MSKCVFSCYLLVVVRGVARKLLLLQNRTEVLFDVNYLHIFVIQQIYKYTNIKTFTAYVALVAII